MQIKLTTSQVLSKIKEHSNFGRKPVNIDQLAEELEMERPQLISHLVDLKLSGVLDFNRDNIILTNSSLN